MPRLSHFDDDWDATRERPAMPASEPEPVAPVRRPRPAPATSYVGRRRSSPADALAGASAPRSDRNVGTNSADGNGAAFGSYGSNGAPPNGIGVNGSPIAEPIGPATNGANGAGPSGSGANGSYGNATQPGSDQPLVGGRRRRAEEDADVVLSRWLGR
jgi:hypothetical protein